MLGGQMSNQEEDEVEDELEAMEREVNGAVPNLPDAPNVISEDMPNVPGGTPEDQAKARWKERAAKQRETGPLAA